ncbi:protein kinase, putative [Talaromyces stipitatus ATCC 10500]|uniref:Protein kinase, putative n=1 Tax=Talaromyces stipitatus (strain ATCC 10500 / CBS 375.48 / QM 6759 / NRRL 1006) TaxID=441959 RepID=B8LXV6_TALSN|nr:protein kinase, putative [Talaromyces stipitatus ATCC 10500]EED22771.1 protein kinase, putative [Talaromyces stipitatus ATCC 10500]
MEVNPTQESTQPYSDPRRMGSHNSGLQDQDVSDIICILHPGSHPAHEAVDATSRHPKGYQHILQRDEFQYDSMDSSSRDIAIRMSSSVHDLSMGFVFGRNPARCDVLLSPEVASKHISNIHFRIFMNEDGILMLQDLSTNGTVVDDTRLWKRNGQTTRMLVNGSVIIVASDNKQNREVRFVVRIPSRDGFHVQYTQNLMAYLERVSKHNAKFKNLQARAPPPQSALQWTLGNPYGMHWTGGSIYNVTGQIGKGAFATVYKLATKQDGIVYAAKELDKRRFMKNGILDQKVDNEMKIMKDLRHPNIVQYIDHHEHDRWIYIIMEYIAGGELSSYLASNGKIAEDMVKSIARQLLHALHYLHKRKITHRDIKPDNILISSIDPLRVKLSDFGLSKVVQEETFMKTFCGTLLYCAPEVYPEYDSYRQGMARKRRRIGDPPPRTSPYDQSVDMWSLGAVLFHLLCGSPPFTGRGDDRGAQMLRTIMTTEADYDLLREEGVSEQAIDFVSRLLRTDPHDRPNERDLFKHQWIVNVQDIDEYSDTEDFLLDDEQLAMITEAAEEELDASQLSINDDFGDDGLRVGGEFEETQMKRPRLDEEKSIHYPSLPHIDSFPAPPNLQVATPNRLFGEVTSSALRSSGIFRGLSSRGVDVTSDKSSGESMEVDADDLSVGVYSFPVPNFTGSAVSLLGAGSLVGQLRMPPSGDGSPKELAAADDKQGTPQSRSVREVTPANQELPDPAQDEHTANEATPKALPFHRRIELPLPDTASESSIQRSESPKHIFNDSASDNKYDELAVTIDARTGREIVDELPHTTDNDYSDRPQLDTETIPSEIPQSFTLSNFLKPRRLLGKLVTVPGSIFELSIRLEGRMTSWGRGPLATIVFPDRMDTRIPAYAVEVTFWCPGIEARIARGEDWMDIPDVMTILSTKTRKCIWVNGVELRRGPQMDNGTEAYHFGKIYHGDIITIWQGNNKYLRFRCELYHGDSARPRPESEKGFIVRQVLHPKSDSNRNRLANRLHDDKLYA